jgi:CBS domain-containing protein
MKISTILATKGMNVITVRPDQSIKEAVGLLVRHNIGALVAVDDAGKPVGILSERDIIRMAARRDDVFGLSVREVMTKDLISASPQDDLKSVMQTMTDKRFRHLPIMDQGQLAGIVSIGDVVKTLLGQYEGVIDTLQTQMTQG